MLENVRHRRDIKMKKLLLLTLMTLSLTGCATLMTLDDPSPYSGVKGDLSVFEPCNGPNPNCIVNVIYLPLAIIDLPLSFVGDTLMLPVKGIQNLVQD